MVALASDIGAAIRAAIIVEQADAAIKARWPAARDQRGEPSEGLFDSAADAATAGSARFALIGAFRRRFAVDVDEAVLFDPEAGLPTHRLIDAEQQVDGNHLLARFEVDLQEDVTAMELFG